MILQFLREETVVCVVYGLFTKQSAALLDRDRFAVTAFAARRSDVSHREGCLAKISKGSIFIYVSCFFICFFSSNCIAFMHRIAYK